MELSPFVLLMGSLGLILVGNALLRNLSLATAIGTLVLALLCGHDLGPSGASPGLTGILAGGVADNALLLLVIFQVIWLSALMAKTGVMQDLVAAVQARVDRAGAMAVLPAVIGWLPMPGGAIFSAPLVAECDLGNEMHGLLKVKINYWFRHIWEYWWPLYPGVLLAIQISGLEPWVFMLLMLPLSALSIATGWFWLLRKVPQGAAPAPAAKRARPPLLPLVAPIGVAIGCYLAFLGLRALFPALEAVNRYLPMVLGLFLSVLLLGRQRPISTACWKEVLLNRKTALLALLVLVIRLYGAVIDAPLPSGTTLVEALRTEMAAWGIPLWAMVVTIPFICGVVTGVAIGFVGGSFPIVMSLLGEGQPTATVLATVVLAYGCGYMGMIFSPVHVCFIVTNEHFGTRLQHALWRLIPLGLTMLAGIALYQGIIRLLPL